MNTLNTVSKIVPGVYLDVNSPYAGTTFPTGTPDQPVNNLADAKLIMAARNLTTIILVGTTGSITFDTMDVNLVGNAGYDITISAAATVKFVGDLVCKSFDNSLATIAEISGDLIVTSGNISNIDGIVQIYGSCSAPGSTLSNGNGIVSIGGNCIVASIVNTTGTVSIGINCSVVTITQNGAGTIQIYGKLSTSKGNIDILIGTLEVDNGIDAPSTIISVTGTLTVYGPMSATTITCTGIINLLGNLILSTALSDTTGTINITGDVVSPGAAIIEAGVGIITINGNVDIDTINAGTGTIAISEDMHARGVTVAGGGTLTVAGIALIYGTLANAGTLAYKGIHPETAVDITAILASETDFLNLVASDGTHYTVDNIFLKSADPGGANDVIVRLYQLVNAVLTIVSSKTINTAGSVTYYSLMDLFGLPHLAGDSIQITVQQEVGGGPTAVTGSYAYHSN